MNERDVALSYFMPDYSKITTIEEDNKSLWISKADDLYDLQKQIKELQKKEQKLSEELKLMQNFQTFSYCGMKYFVEERIGKIDYNAIPELKSVNLELYRKPPISVWKLIIERRTIL